EKLMREHNARETKRARVWFEPKQANSRQDCTAIKPGVQEKACSPVGKAAACDDSDQNTKKRVPLEENIGAANTGNKASVGEGGSPQATPGGRATEPSRPRTVDRAMWRLSNEPKSLKDLNLALGRYSVGDASTPGLFHFPAPSLEDVVRTSAPKDLSEGLAATSLYVWCPKGGRCPSCSSTQHSPKDLCSIKWIVGSDSGWPARLLSVRRQCLQCQASFTGTSTKYLESLPHQISDSLLS
ncbi:hypothetical protein FOZ63_015862, partial [Perkinsus olseni]